MGNTPFLYGELNKQVEYLRYKFQSTDNTTLVKVDADTNTVGVAVNTTQLVTLKQVKKDASKLDDPIKYYSLYAYNPYTKAYDLKLGDEIVVDTTFSDDISSAITDAWIKVGEEQARDENGELLWTEDEFGNKIPLMKPVYEKIETVVSTETGQLQLANIPVSALSDKNDDGSFIISVLDGNGEEVY